MTTITISRQLGSLGTTLGRMVAKRLGYRLAHRDVINRAAHLTGSPDMALATIDELGLLGIEPDEQSYKAYLNAVRQVIESLAEKGNVVIVGRAGQSILQHRPDVLHVRVIAPIDVRVSRIVQAHGISEAAARAQVEDSDRYRANYLQRFYHVQWDAPGLYHLIINTGHMPLEDAAEVVCTAARQMERHIPINQEVSLE